MRASVALSSAPRRFVENQDRCVFQHRARDGEALAFAARKRAAALRDERGIPFRFDHNERVRFGEASGYFELVVRRVRSPMRKLSAIER